MPAHRVQPDRRPWTIFLPFAAGYLLSYLFRTINGPLADRLVVEFALDASSLGLLTSAYFFTFAAFQLPLGALIDRFGPRRVQVVLSIVAAAGAVLIAGAHSLSLLIAGRAIIGLGTSGALMTGLKALNLWTPRPRLTAMNGLYIMFGGLGAMASTYPTGWLSDAMGWRGTFYVLAATTLAIAATTWLAVPEKTTDALPEPWRDVFVAFGKIYRTASFWRVAPLSAMIIGTAFAVHGLWAARWMMDVNGIATADITSNLLLMGAGLTIGAATIGMLASWLRARGVGSANIFAGACGLFLLVQLVILTDRQLPAWLPWSCFALFGGMTVLGYSMLADIFPQERIGRANGALNVLHIGMAFVIQSLIGAVTNMWAPDAAGAYPLLAYQTALAVPVVLQVLALLWFLLAPLLSKMGSIPAKVCNAT